MGKIKVVILDDHQIVIDGLQLLLGNEPGIEVLGSFTNGIKMLQELPSEMQIDILLLDLMMPEISGYDCALAIQQRFPQIKIIILSMTDDVKLIHNLIDKADIKSFLPKSADRHLLVSVIEKVFAGGQYFSENILEMLSDYKTQMTEKSGLSLSSRELEIIKLLSSGKTNREISNQLYISELTVATHRKNISRKTDTHNVAELMGLVNRLGLLD